MVTLIVFFREFVAIFFTIDYPTDGIVFRAVI